MPISAVRVAGVYAAVAASWIVFSDRIVDALGWQALHTVKGLLFVCVTAATLYFHLRHEAAKQSVYEKALKDASASKSRLIAAVSHDLRQPMQSMSLFAGVLELESLSPRGGLAVDNLHRSVARMAAQLQAILDLARMDLGGLVVNRAVVAVGEVVRGVVEDMAPQAQAKALRLRWVDSALRVRTDPALLGTMLRNLVANAIRYTDSGGIVVGCRRRRGEVHVVVCDTGVGIAEDKLGLIFEEFYQAGNEARDHALGLGLGLAIVERMARLLGHRIVVRSTPARGSCFAIVLPRA